MSGFTGNPEFDPGSRISGQGGFPDVVETPPMQDPTRTPVDSNSSAIGIENGSDSTRMAAAINDNHNHNHNGSDTNVIVMSDSAIANPTNLSRTKPETLARLEVRVVDGGVIDGSNIDHSPTAATFTLSLKNVTAEAALNLLRKNALLRLRTLDFEL
jgi:hypothetical protein